MNSDIGLTSEPVASSQGKPVARRSERGNEQVRDQFELASAADALRDRERRSQVSIASLPGSAVLIVDRQMRYVLEHDPLKQSHGPRPGGWSGRARPLVTL